LPKDLLIDCEACIFEREVRLVKWKLVENPQKRVDKYVVRRLKEPPDKIVWKVRLEKERPPDRKVRRWFKERRQK
jgi:hypothetical protein